MLAYLETSKDFATSVDNRALSDTEMENVAGGCVCMFLGAVAIGAALGASWALGQYVGERARMSWK